MRATWLISAILVLGSPLGAAADVTGAACASADLVLTFSPPLTRAAASGTATLAGRNICTVATVSDDPPGESVTVPSGQVLAAGSYLGDCSFAVLTFGNTAYLLLGGATLVGGGIVLVVVPDEVCNESSATGIGVGLGVWALDV